MACKYSKKEQAVITQGGSVVKNSGVDLWQNQPSIREILRAEGITIRKSFGQNFLCDQGLCDKLAALIPPMETGSLLEIGPGPGGLTRSLLTRHQIDVVVIEKDRRFGQALKSLEEAAHPKLKIVVEDALHRDLSLLVEDEPRYLQSNLPFNVATPLMIELLQNFEKWQEWVLMVQKEVGQRLLANTGSKAYGRLSVLAQGLCKVEHLMEVKSTAFYPQPKVDAWVVRMTPKKEIWSSDFGKQWQSVNDLLRVSFSFRRKKLAVVLARKAGVDTDTARQVGITDNTRADNLGIEAYWELAGLLGSSKTALRK